VALRFRKTPDELKKMSLSDIYKAYSYILYEDDVNKESMESYGTKGN